MQTLSRKSWVEPLGASAGAEPAYTFTDLAYGEWADVGIYKAIKG